jgi:hypothetical protein
LARAWVGPNRKSHVTRAFEPSRGLVTCRPARTSSRGCTWPARRAALRAADLRGPGRAARRILARFRGRAENGQMSRGGKRRGNPATRLRVGLCDAAEGQALRAGSCSTSGSGPTCTRRTTGPGQKRCKRAVEAERTRGCLAAMAPTAGMAAQTGRGPCQPGSPTARHDLAGAGRRVGSRQGTELGAGRGAAGGVGGAGCWYTCGGMRRATGAGRARRACTWASGAYRWRPARVRQTTSFIDNSIEAGHSMACRPARWTPARPARLGHSSARGQRAAGRWAWLCGCLAAGRETLVPRASGAWRLVAWPWPSDACCP